MNFADFAVVPLDTYPYPSHHYHTPLLYVLYIPYVPSTKPTEPVVLYYDRRSCRYKPSRRPYLFIGALRSPPPTRSLLPRRPTMLRCRAVPALKSKVVQYQVNTILNKIHWIKYFVRVLTYLDPPPCCQGGDPQRLLRCCAVACKPVVK